MPKPKEPNVSVEFLRDRFYIDTSFEEGPQLRYRKSVKGHRAGSLAGTLSVQLTCRKMGKTYKRHIPRTSRRVRINGRRYGEHRVIFAMQAGRWPETFVDHGDNNGTNNRICNIRPATAAENSWNRVRHGGRHHDLPKNIYPNPNGFRIEITKHGVAHRKCFGYSRYSSQAATLAAAIEFARQKRLELFGEFANHGEQCIVVDQFVTASKEKRDV